MDKINPLTPSAFCLFDSNEEFPIWMKFQTKKPQIIREPFLQIKTFEKGVFACMLTTDVLFYKKKCFFKFKVEENRGSIKITRNKKVLTLKTPFEIPETGPIFKVQLFAHRFFLSSLAFGALFIITSFTPPSIFGRLLLTKSKSLLVLFSGALASLLRYRHWEKKTLEMRASFFNLFFNIYLKAIECQNKETIEMTSLLDPGRLELCDPLVE